MVTSRTGWFNDASEILFSEQVSSTLEGIARRKYKMKQIFMQGSTSAEVYSYYQATTRNLGQNDAGTDKLLLKNSTVRGIPRGATFPQDKRELQRLNAFMEKHGLEVDIFWEDITSNNVALVQERMIDLSSSVARSIDVMLASAITNATGIQTQAAVATWDNATETDRRPFEDLVRGAALLSAGENTSYEADYILTSPGDGAYLWSNDTVLDAFSATSADLITNGVVGKIAGLNWLPTSVLADDTAYVLQSKRCGGLQTSVPFQSTRITDDYVKITLRAVERAVAFITNPSAICSITNTRS